MVSNRSNTLGGEGWPGAYVANGAENRNISAIYIALILQVHAALNRTLQEQAGLSGTTLTQQTGFVFTERSP